MVLGQSLEDAAGQRHAMTSLLGHSTSFAKRKLHLGYRTVRLRGDSSLGSAGALVRGHEFHYASIVEEGSGAPLFTAADADGVSLGAMGQVAGTVMGSFVHLIDAA